MSRSFGFPVLIVSLAIGGFLFVRQSQTVGPTSSVAQQAETQAAVAASATDFNAALPDLQAWFADHGTYAGVTLPPVYGIHRRSRGRNVLLPPVGRRAPGWAGRPGAARPLLNRFTLRL